MTTRNRRRIPSIRPLAVGVLLAIVLVVALIVITSSGGSSQTSAVDQVALSYAERQMVFNSGPEVRSTHTLLLRNLSHALATYTRRSVAKDVNVRDLIRRFGANRRVTLVVLSAVYNTLPPDEGVVVNGQVVVLVDTRTNRPLPYLMD